MNKKGQDLSLTTIILAALGMIILVVLVMIFTGQTGKLNIGLGNVQMHAQCNSACRAYPDKYVGGQFVADELTCSTEGGAPEFSVRGEGKMPLCCCTLKVQTPT